MHVVGVDAVNMAASNVSVSGSVTVIDGDITDAAFMRSVFTNHTVDVVYHMADYSGIGISHHIPTYTYAHNLVATANIVSEAVRTNVTKFVMMSSTAVYGGAAGPWAESMAPVPSEPYGISKLAAEQHLASAGANFGLDYAILRLHTLYGPGMDMRSVFSNIVARAIVKALTDGHLTLMGDGSQKRQFTYIDDVVPYVVEAAFLRTPPPAVVNVGSDEITSVSEVIDAVAAAAGTTVHVEHVPSRLGDVHHVQAVHDRAKCLFSVRPFTPFKVGLQRTIEWARRAEDGLGEIGHLESAEIMQAAPEVWTQAEASALVH